MRTYNDINISIRNLLRDSGIEACAQEARIILAKAAGKTTQQLLRDIRLYASPEIEKAAMDMAGRRIDGEPVAYITNEWEFYGLPFYITDDVLIPRMDTEVAVDAVKELLTGNNMNARVLDLCTGSGCIACAIAKELPATRLVAVDISAAALEVAKKNINLNRLASRIITLKADAEMTPPMSIGQFDVIVSNPPYIASAEIQTLDSSVKDYEPMWALDGGPDGYKFYKSIIKYWKACLKPGGSIVFEVGEGQAERVSEMLLAGGFRSTAFRKDTLGIDRVVIGRI